MTRRAWWRELRRRWPLIVAVLRGHDAAYHLTIVGGSLRVTRPTVVTDCHFVAGIDIDSLDSNITFVDCHFLDPDDGGSE